MLDFLIINPGNRINVYQKLATELTAIEQPTFALLVARYLMHKGYSVKVIDIPATSLTPEQVAKLVEDFDPLLVGLYIYGYQPSASTQNMQAARAVCQAIKNVNKDRVILMSGTHPAALPEQTLKEEPVDFVCSGEGFETPEQLIYLLKNDLLKGFDGVQRLKEIPDLWWMSHHPTVDTPPQVKFSRRGALLTSAQLNAWVDRPAWELTDMSMYRSHNWHAFGHMSRQPYASIYTSLGCPFQCVFCCINTPFGDMMNGPRPYRLWSPEVIIDQIDMLVNKYGCYSIKFVDEMFVLNPDHVMKLCDLIIERKYNVNIWAYARIDSVKDKFLEKLKKAGFNWLALGIESASKHVRDGANKKYANEDIITVVEKIRKHGIYVIGNYIFGLPDDDLVSMQNTLDLALQLKTEFANFYSAMAYPGSPLYNTALQNGWELPKSWLGYSQHSYDCLPLKTDFISSADVLRFRDQAFTKYFSDTGYQNHILKIFGQETVDSINEMLKYSLKRKLLGD